MIWNGPHTQPSLASSRGGAWLRVLKRTKNGQSSRADGGSMGPSALDREN
jgi:hypothetical protein